MDDIFQAVFNFLPNPYFGLSSLASFVMMVVKSNQAKSQKASYAKGNYEDKASLSKQAQGIKSRLEITSYIFLILGVLTFILAIAAPYDLDEIFKNDNSQQGEVEDMLNPKGGYMKELPIISIPRECVPISIHEGQNYSLIAGSFNDENEAIKKKSQLETFRIRDIEYFPKECDSIYGVYGTYLLFIGRKYNSLSSAENKEKYYEAEFKKKEYLLDLKIVKFENFPFRYTNNRRFE